MIRCTNHACTFVPRAGAVIMRGQQILLHRMVDDSFWSLPGGRCELLESSARCVEREIHEELGVPATSRRLLRTAETFFAHNSGTYHELGLYHLVDLPAEYHAMTTAGPFTGSEGRLRLAFSWFGLDEVPSLELYPRFLRQRLLALPATPKHRVEWSLPKRT